MDVFSAATPDAFFATVDGSVTSLGWREKFPQFQDEVRSVIFKKTALKDDLISEDEISTGLQKYHDESRPWSTINVNHNFMTRLAKFNLPYRIPYNLELELLSAVRSKGAVLPFFERHVVKHLPTDKDQIEQKDNIDDKVHDYRPDPVLPDTMLPNEDTGYLPMFTDSKTFDKHISMYRNMQFKDVPLSEKPLLYKETALKTVRTQDYDKYEQKFDEKFMNFVRGCYKDVMEELLEKSWQPENPYEKPIFRKGGFDFQQWKRELDELLIEHKIPTQH